MPLNVTSWMRGRHSRAGAFQIQPANSGCIGIEGQMVKVEMELSRKRTLILFILSWVLKLVLKMTYSQACLIPCKHKDYDGLM